MSIYPGDRPLGRFITDREARKLEIFPELVEALGRLLVVSLLDENSHLYSEIERVAVKARGEMR